MSFFIPADGAASDTEEHTVWDNNTGYDMIVIAASYCPVADVTANGSNYATLDLSTGDGAGGAPSSIATARDTSSTGFTADTPDDFAGLTGSDQVDDGEVLVLNQTKTGTGVQLPNARLSVVLEYT